MGRSKTFNRLPQAKQLAKQLILHRLCDGKTQDTVAKLFKEYAEATEHLKILKENRYEFVGQ